MSNKEVETVAPPSDIQPDQNSGPVPPTNVVDTVHIINKFESRKMFLIILLLVYQVISDDTIESAATNASKVQSNDKKVRWFLSIWKKSLPPKKAKSNDVVDALTPTGTVLTSGGINTKKATANGLMDFAFLTANANQLNQAINNWPNKNRTLIIVLISISIGLQVSFQSRHNYSNKC